MEVAKMFYVIISFIMLAVVIGIIAFIVTAIKSTREPKMGAAAYGRHFQSMERINCPFCGCSIEKNSKYCSQCGQPIDQYFK